MVASAPAPSVAAPEVAATPALPAIAPSSVTAAVARDGGDGPLPCEVPTLGCGADAVTLAAWASARGVRAPSGDAGEGACTADDAHDALYCLTGSRVGDARWFRRVERLEVYRATRARVVRVASLPLAMSIFDALDVRPNLVLLRARPTTAGVTVDEDPRLPACDIAREAPGDADEARWARGDASWRARICASRGTYVWQGARWRRAVAGHAR